MGSSESTGRSNGTKQEEEEEEEHRRNHTSGGGSSGGGSSGGGSGAAGTAIAVAGTVVAVAWGISKVLSASKETENNNMMTIKASSLESSSHFNRSNSSPNTWCPPPRGRFKMNTDGGARPNPGPAGYGGILRDHCGQWVLGFRGFIGVDHGLAAEFHGILKGLELLDELGYTGSILESDCEPAIEWIKKTDKSYDGNRSIIECCWPIIIECRRLIWKNNVEINHVYRDNANKCADKLANMGIDNRDEYMFIGNLPDEIKQFYDADLQSLKENSLSSYLPYSY